MVLSTSTGCAIDCQHSKPLHWLLERSYICDVEMKGQYVVLSFIFDNSFLRRVAGNHVDNESTTLQV